MTRRRRSRSEERAFKALLYLGGAVATAAGLHSAVAGARSLPGQDRADPVLESELRYYGAFYAAYGVQVLRVAHRAHRDPAAVEAIAGALLAAGAARSGGWLAAGAPHPLQRGLLAVELAAPAVAVAWQRRLARR